ncbi:MAG: DUF4230 domain-containing protein [Pontixanthobacter sp.]
MGDAHATDAQTDPKPAKQPNLARVQAVPWLIVILLIALCVWLAWRAFFFNPASDPIDGAMLAFEKQGTLTVYSSRFEVAAESSNTTSLGPIDLASSEQLDIIPATIDYSVNLASVGRDRMSWDDGSDTLSITLPPLKVSKVDLDEARRKSFTEGRFVTRGASSSLTDSNLVQAERKAAAFAKDAEVMAAARAATKDAVRQNLAIPLQMAGYDDIELNVRFDGEKEPTS